MGSQGILPAPPQPNNKISTEDLFASLSNKEEEQLAQLTQRLLIPLQALAKTHELL